MRRAPTARLFAALEVPLAVREELLAWSRGALSQLAARVPGAAEGAAPGVRLLDPELMHVTLCFLGSRPVAEIAPLAAAVEGFEGRACELAVGAPVWLPPRRPQALAVSIIDEADGEDGLAALQARLAAALAAAGGWVPERRRFRAHLTVARLRRGARTAAAAAAALAPTPPLAFSARTIVLQRSWLSPRGASYETLALRELDAG